MSTMNDLYTPVPAYRAFVENQVLTEKQLNEIIAYFNYQDRLSRVLLSGVGIVCGLQISLKKNASNEPLVILTEGVAVTTAGNLLKADNTIYTKFRRFEDRSAAYPLFRREDGSVLNIFELVTDEKTGTDLVPLKEFDDQPDFILDQMVVILYLESFPEPELDCSPVACNSQGQLMVENLRLLLISREEAQGLLPHNIDNPEILKELFEPVYVPRKILKPENTKTYQQIVDLYNLNFTHLKSKLLAWNETGLINFSEFNSLPDFAKDFTGNKKKYFQYHFDFYKDLADVYNETVGKFKDGYSYCCPNPKAFPKHVLLGTFDYEPGYRHPFFPSKTHGKSDLKSFSDGFQLMAEMISRYSSYESLKVNIKITPSLMGNIPLNNKATPFYYPYNNEGIDEFYDIWSENSFVPNYYRYRQPAEIDNPLEIELKGHDFYRIEGHIGQSILTAMNTISKLRKENGLPFDIVPISVGESVLEAAMDYDKYRVYFEDLQAILQAWNREQNCLFHGAINFLTGFSLEVEGEHSSFPNDSKNNQEKEEADPMKDEMKRVQSPTNYFKPKTSENINVLYLGTHKSMGSQAVGMEMNVSSNYNYYDGFAQSLNIHAATLGSTLYTEPVVHLSKGDFYLKWYEYLNIIGKWFTSDMHNVTIEYPLILLGYLNEVISERPDDIQSFTEKNFNIYIDKLYSLSEKAEEIKLELNQILLKEDNKIKNKLWLSDYFNILNQLIASKCLIEKTEVLYQEILSRKKKLFGEMVLSSFIEKHPGAEHRAGVQKGGTFILLYYLNQKNNETRLPMDFPNKVMGTVQFQGVLNTLVRTGVLKLNKGKEEQFYSEFEFQKTGCLSVFTESAINSEYVTLNYPLETLNDVVKLMTGAEASQLLDKTMIPDATRYSPSVSPHLEGMIHDILDRYRPMDDNAYLNYTVIGDLSLPYLCCSQAPPAAFVFPEQLAFLSLDKYSVCVRKDDETIVHMDVLPVGADVKVFAGEEEIEGLVSEDGRYILASKLPEPYYGQELRFEVNGQKMEPLLRVLKYPEPKFSFIDPKLNDKIFELNLKNETENFSEMTFKWEINDKPFDVEGNLKEIGTSIFIDDFPYEGTVKLIASNGICSNERLKSFTVSEPVEVEKLCFLEEFFHHWKPSQTILSRMLEWRGIEHKHDEQILKSDIQKLLDNLNQTRGFSYMELISIHLLMTEYKEDDVNSLNRFLSYFHLKYGEDFDNPENFAKKIIKIQSENCRQEEGTFINIFEKVNLEISNIGPKDFPNLKGKVLVSGRPFELLRYESKTMVIDFLRQGTKIKISPDGFEDEPLEVETSNIKIELKKKTPSDALVVDGSLLGKTNLEKVLKERGLDLNVTKARSILKKNLDATTDGNRLNSDELGLLTNKTLKYLLRENKISFRSNDTKQVLIELLRNNGKNIKADLDKLEVEELEKIIRIRKVAIPEAELKAEYLKLLGVDKNEIEIRDNELTLITKEGLMGVADSLGIKVKSNISKDDLIQQIRNLNK